MKKILCVLLLIVVVFCKFSVTAKNSLIKNVNNDDNSYGDSKSLTRQEFEKAFQEVAWAYYMRGEYIQYNSQKYNGKEGYYSPEEATSQNINYSVCSGYTYNVYKDFLNIGIRSFTISHLNYARDNAGKVGIVAYGKKIDDYNAEFVFNNGAKSISIKNPSLSTLLSYIRIGDVLTYTGHTMIVYDLIYENGNVVDAYVIESRHGEYKVNSKINSNNNDYLYYNNQWSYQYNDVLSGGERIKEGSLHLGKLSQTTHWKELNYRVPKYTKEEYTILRFYREKKGKLILTYHGDEENDGKEIELSAKTNDRLKYPRLFIEKTVSEHNDDVVSAGDKLTYIIIVRNSSSQKYNNEIVVTENISNYVDYNGIYTVSRSDVKYKKKSDKKIEFRIPALASKEKVTIKYTVSVKNNTVGKEIKSTGKVGNIDSSIIRNTVGNNLTKNQMKTIKESYNSLISGNLKGSKLIDAIYEKIGYDLQLKKINIKNLVKNTSLKSTMPSTLYLNTKDRFYKAVLNKYYGSLSLKNNIYNLKLWNNYYDETRRADTIYPENFKTGDILIYSNANDPTTNENGDYYYIYIDGEGFVGKNGSDSAVRNKFNASYYQDNLYVYRGKNPTDINVEMFNYQTLFGKDYYVILRPSLMMISEEKSLTGDVDGNGKVETLDYLKVRKHILSSPTLSGEELKRADVNGDGSIDTADYQAIRRIVMNL